MQNRLIKFAVKQKCKQAKEKWFEEKFAEIEKLSSNAKEMFKDTKQLFRGD